MYACVYLCHFQMKPVFIFQWVVIVQAIQTRAFAPVFAKVTLVVPGRLSAVLMAVATTVCSLSIKVHYR